jgi:hypothetical protein
MAEPKKKFIYNDEFKDLDQQPDDAKFSSVWFAVYSKAISDKFYEYDEETKALKLKFQWSGYGVVVLAVVALSIAALEPTVLRPLAPHLPEHAVEAAAVLAALAGIASVVMGYYGMGISDRKMHWLRNRMLCERIRQWRWQYYCAHIPEILAASGNEAQEAEYKNKRDDEFSDFVTKLKAHDKRELQAILSEDVQEPNAVWVQPEFKGNIELQKTLDTIEAAMHRHSKPADEILAAYRKVRIGAQQRYAEYIVTTAGAFSTHPARQKEWLHKYGVGLLLTIFGLHILVIWGILLCPFPPQVASVVSVSAVILALIALGLRTVEDGLRPSEHLTRFTGYLGEVSSIAQAFDGAGSALTERNLMIALETATYKEMVNFLQAGNRSRYVM